MQIVIELSEKDYDDITLAGENTINLGVLLALRKAVRNGTPLPKGHGRLIDYGYVVDAIDDWVNAEEYRYTNATEYLRKRVANIPTIIEADRGE